MRKVMLPVQLSMGLLFATTFVYAAAGSLTPIGLAFGVGRNLRSWRRQEMRWTIPAIICHFRAFWAPLLTGGSKGCPRRPPYYEAFRPHVSPIRLLAHWHIFGPAVGIQRLLRQPDPAQKFIIASSASS